MDVAEVVAKWTGIPVSKMLEGEIQKLLKMEDRLKARVVGQDSAIHAVANVVRRARRTARPKPTDRVIYFSRPHRRRQNRTLPRPRPIFVRRRTGDGSLGYVGVHGETFRLASDRRPSGLRRL
jgi:hypothetical protein